MHASHPSAPTAETNISTTAMGVPAPTNAAPAGAPQSSPVTPKNKGGRPRLFDKVIIDSITGVIIRTGCSDSAAALFNNIGVSTLSRWKKEHPGITIKFGAAREYYRQAKLAMINDATHPDGRPDWRAAAWALEKAFPQDYGKRSRRQTFGEPDPEPDECVEDAEEITYDPVADARDAEAAGQEEPAIANDPIFTPPIVRFAVANRDPESDREDPAEIAKIVELRAEAERRSAARRSLGLPF